MKRILAATTALLGVMVAQNAWALNATSTMAASGTVPAACTITSTPLAFRSIHISTISNATASVSVNCTLGATYSIGMDYGLHGTSTQRALLGTDNSTVNYNIYTDFLHGTPWGNIDGVDALAGTGNGATQLLTVFGQVPSQIGVVDQAYSDTVTVTLTY
jgi:spore coat protein U-like protein